MSLWEKWEREKLEKQGIKFDRGNDGVKIYDTRLKPNIYRQVGFVLGTTLLCLVMVYAAMVLEALSSGRKWSDTYIVRLFVERNAQRERMAGNQQ